MTRSDLNKADIYGADFTNALIDKTQQMVSQAAAAPAAAAAAAAADEAEAAAAEWGAWATRSGCWGTPAARPQQDHQLQLFFQSAAPPRPALPTHPPCLPTHLPR